MKESPAATSVVTEEVLDSMPRGVAAEEALSLVPGVKLPLNDPSGFAPDLFDVDWSTVSHTNAASVDGFALIGPRVGFQWKSGSYRAQILFSIRNLLNADYIAFTEPDPDGNSYQPGPRREYFVGGRVWLGQ